MKKYTQILADYLSGLRYEDIPPEVVERAKVLTLHTIGAGISACRTNAGQKAISMAKTLGSGSLNATLLGDGASVSITNATMANGALCDMLNWEDCSWTGHPSAGAVPAGLAMAEAHHKSGQDYLTALIGGYDVYQRISSAVQPSPERFLKGWGLFSWQIFAPAMVSGKLLDLDPVKTNQLIGAAALMTPVATDHINKSFTDFYHYQHGLTAKSGIECAMITQNGFYTLMDALETCGGYYIGVSDQCDWDWLDRNLGKEFLIMETLIKHWPVNMWVQVPVDMIDLLVRENGLRADDIDLIEVSPFLPARGEDIPKEGFDSILRAQFNIPYCVAMYLKGPKPGGAWLDGQYMTDPVILEMASHIHSTGPLHSLRDCFVKFQQRGYPEYTMKLTTKDGHTFETSMRFPKGHPKNPYTLEESAELFRGAAGDILGHDKTEALIDLIFNRLEQVKDLSILKDYVAP